MCGEYLEDCCSNSECGAGLEEGSFCRICGSPYVTATVPVGGNAVEWADTTRSRIRELRSMSATRLFVQRAAGAGRPPGGRQGAHRTGG